MPKHSVMSNRKAFLAILLTGVLIVSCNGSPEAASPESNSMQNQPTPKVTTDDVSRIIIRDFGAERSGEVKTILSEYGKQDWQRDSPRVHLAILKLAKSDLELLRRETKTACSDYRDVLSPAEYIRYAELGWSTTPDKHAEEVAIQEDWKEYQEWLNRK